MKEDINTSDVIEYLKSEIDYLQENEKLQFNHFMNVFLFWSAVISIPTTAGILTKDFFWKSAPFGIVLILVGLLGFFIAVKMFDIRCSQLHYITIINDVRQTLFDLIKSNDLEGYVHPFPNKKDLVEVALHDFGMRMAEIMSSVEGVLIAFGIMFITNSIEIDFVVFKLLGYFIGYQVAIIAGFSVIFFGLSIYKKFVLKKIPRQG